LGGGGRNCIVYVSSPLRSSQIIELLRGSVGRVVSEFVDAGVATSAGELAGMLDGCSVGVVVVATGGVESTLVEGLKRFKGLAGIVAHPYANSTAALLEAYPLLAARGIPAVVLPSLEGGVVESRVGGLVRGLSAAARLRSSRLGVVGGPSPWLVYSRVDAEIVERRLGVKLVEIGLDELVEVYRHVDDSSLHGLAERVAANAAYVDRGVDELVRALKVYAALKSIIGGRGLDAITVECFRVIERLDTTACLAFSLLNSEGVVAGCEADVPSTIAMMIASWATGLPAFMANVAGIDAGELVLAHCTAPLSLGEYRLLSHFETGKGVGVSVKYPLSKATILRLDPGLERARVGVGEIVASGLLSPLRCRTQVKLRVGWDTGRLLEESMGNHVVLVPGFHLDEVRHALTALGIAYEVLA